MNKRACSFIPYLRVFTRRKSVKRKFRHVKRRVNSILQMTSCAIILSIYLTKGSHKVNWFPGSPQTVPRQFPGSSQAVPRQFPGGPLAIPWRSHSSPQVTTQAVPSWSSGSTQAVLRRSLGGQRSIKFSEACMTRYSFQSIF